MVLLGFAEEVLRIVQREARRQQSSENRAERREEREKKGPKIITSQAS